MISHRTWVVIIAGGLDGLPRGNTGAVRGVAIGEPTKGHVVGRTVDGYADALPGRVTSVFLSTGVFVGARSGAGCVATRELSADDTDARPGHTLPCRGALVVLPFTGGACVRRGHDAHVFYGAVLPIITCRAQERLIDTLGRALVVQTDIDGARVVVVAVDLRSRHLSAQPGLIARALVGTGVVVITLQTGHGCGGALAIGAQFGRTDVAVVAIAVTRAAALR